MYKTQRNYENTKKAVYEGTGEYQIPEIVPTQYRGCDWIGFNFASGAKGREKKGVHVHHGYYHNERDGTKGATKLNTNEKKMLEKVKRVWYDYLGRR